MGRLTGDQVRHLTGMMDERFAREIDEIDAVTARSRAERGQEALAGFPADHLDAALAEIASDADYAVVRQDVADVRDILAARLRVNAGTYGTCVDCVEAIGYQRLLAYPTAKRCIACQREHESEPGARVGRRAR